MIIKTITKQGKAIPLSPKEALVPALVLGLTGKNDREFIYWTHDKAPTVSTFDVQSLPDDNYEAKATGTFFLGKTKIPSDIFYTPKLCDFSIHYMSSKDPIGAPHLTVVSMDVSLASTDPSQNVGIVPENSTVACLTLGEITPSVGGKIRGKK